MSCTLIHPATGASLTVSADRADAAAATDRSALVPWRTDAQVAALPPVSRNPATDADGRPYTTAARERLEHPEREAELAAVKRDMDARQGRVGEADGLFTGNGHNRSYVARNESKRAAQAVGRLM